VQVLPRKVITEDGLQLLRRFIEAGGYTPGDRLPAERELIRELGVTRNTLRKSLDVLEHEGVVWRHVGKGTFITALDSQTNIPGLAELSNQITPLQMMRSRLAIEPAIAREAALNASAEAISKLKQVRNSTLEAESWNTYEANDDAFHRAIAQATENILLLSLFDHLNQVRRAVAWQQVVRKTETPPTEHPSFGEHEQIFAMIEQRDPLGAHEAMRNHLSSVSIRLFGGV